MNNYSPLSGRVFSGNTGKGNLGFIPEFRVDKASQNVFPDKNDEATNLAAQRLFAAVFSF